MKLPRFTKKELLPQQTLRRMKWVNAKSQEHENKINKRHMED